MSIRAYLICRIIFTCLFLVISTNIWFKREMIVYHDVKSSIVSNEVIISNLKRQKDDDDSVYNLKLENKEDKEQDVKVYIVPDVLATSVSNNYIKYQINDGRVKTLNMDGIIIISKLESYETQDINLKLWISDTYNGDLNYEGRVVVA
ncbi:MAG: hypothetical protein IJ068_01645 [Bacilli bacterium]|nr:hypothetical protein [Bacilli bacterium]